MSDKKVSSKRKRSVSSDAMEPILYLEISSYEFHKYHSSIIENEDFKRPEFSITDLCKQILSGTSSDEDILRTKRNELQKLQKVINYYLEFEDIYKLFDLSVAKEAFRIPESPSSSASTSSSLRRIPSVEIIDELDELDRTQLEEVRLQEKTREVVNISKDLEGGLTCSSLRSKPDVEIIGELVELDRTQYEEIQLQKRAKVVNILDDLKGVEILPSKIFVANEQRKNDRKRKYTDNPDLEKNTNQQYKTTDKRKAGGLQVEKKNITVDLVEDEEIVTISSNDETEKTSCIEEKTCLPDLPQDYTRLSPKVSTPNQKYKNIREKLINNLQIQKNHLVEDEEIVTKSSNAEIEKTSCIVDKTCLPDLPQDPTLLPPKGSTPNQKYKYIRGKLINDLQIQRNHLFEDEEIVNKSSNDEIEKTSCVVEKTGLSDLPQDRILLPPKGSTPKQKYKHIREKPINNLKIQKNHLDKNEEKFPESTSNDLGASKRPCIKETELPSNLPDGLKILRNKRAWANQQEKSICKKRKMNLHLPKSNIKKSSVGENTEVSGSTSKNVSATFISSCATSQLTLETNTKDSHLDTSSDDENSSSECKASKYLTLKIDFEPCDIQECLDYLTSTMRAKNIFVPQSSKSVDQNSEEIDSNENNFAEASENSNHFTKEIDSSENNFVEVAENGNSIAYGSKGLDSSENDFVEVLQNGNTVAHAITVIDSSENDIVEVPQNSNTVAHAITVIDSSKNDFAGEDCKESEVEKELVIFPTVNHSLITPKPGINFHLSASYRNKLKVTRRLRRPSILKRVLLKASKTFKKPQANHDQ